MLVPEAAIEEREIQEREAKSIKGMKREGNRMRPKENELKKKGERLLLFYLVNENSGVINKVPSMKTESRTASLEFLVSLQNSMIAGYG